MRRLSLVIAMLVLLCSQTALAGENQPSFPIVITAICGQPLGAEHDSNLLSGSIPRTANVIVFRNTEEVHSYLGNFYHTYLAVVRTRHPQPFATFETSVGASFLPKGIDEDFSGWTTDEVINLIERAITLDVLVQRNYRQNGADQAQFESKLLEILFAHRQYFEGKRQETPFAVMPPTLALGQSVDAPVAASPSTNSPGTAVSLPDASPSPAINSTPAVSLTAVEPDRFSLPARPTVNPAAQEQENVSPTAELPTAVPRSEATSSLPPRLTLAVPVDRPAGPKLVQKEPTPSGNKIGNEASAPSAAAPSTTPTTAAPPVPSASPVETPPGASSPATNLPTVAPELSGTINLPSPNNLAAEPGNEQIDLTWDKVDRVKGYMVYVDDQYSTYTPETHCRITGLKNYEVVRIKVIPRSELGLGRQAAVVEATPRGPKPMTTFEVTTVLLFVLVLLVVFGGTGYLFWSTFRGARSQIGPHAPPKA